MGLLNESNIAGLTNSTLNPLVSPYFGNAFYTFVQELIKIRSLFYEDFQLYLGELFGDKCVFGYRHPIKDPDGKYPVDCCVENGELLFIFGLNSDNKCRDVTITCLTYEKWDIHFNSISIFENQEDISKKVLSRFSDVIEKQYSSLSSAKERMPEYSINRGHDARI